MKPKRRPEANSGARGESLAAAHLAALGYRVVARNVRTAQGEIDLLARDGSDWVAVEVKARQDHPAPEATVRGEQLERIARSLQTLARKLRPRPTSLRIDIVAIRWGAETEIRLFRGVRSWHIARATCGSASVQRRDPADTQNHGRLAASAFALARALCFKLLRRLSPLRRLIRPVDGHSR